MATAEDLLRAYWDAAGQRGPHLEQFVQSAVDGAYGPVDAATIRAFLLAVEENIVSNIENKAQAGGPWAMMAEQAIAETREEIAQLVARYARG